MIKKIENLLIYIIISIERLKPFKTLVVWLIKGKLKVYEDVSCSKQKMIEKISEVEKKNEESGLEEKCRQDKTRFYRIEKTYRFQKRSSAKTKVLSYMFRIR